MYEQYRLENYSLRISILWRKFERWPKRVLTSASSCTGGDTVALRPLDNALFAAGEINAVCWRAASLFPGQKRLHGDENCSTHPPSVLSIDMSRLSFRMRVFSLYAPNSFPIFSSCNILCSQGGQDWTSEVKTPHCLLSPAFRTNLLFPIVYHSKTSVNSYRTRRCTSYKAVRFMSITF
jgi:hypothetical protein